MYHTRIPAHLTVASRPDAQVLDRAVASGMLDPVVAAGPLLYFTSDLVHEGRNGNGDVFTPAEMQQAWPTLIGMPLDKDHILQVDGAVGQLIDAQYGPVNGIPTIRVAAYIHAGFYPDVAWKTQVGIITGISMECLFEQGVPISMGRLLRNIVFIGAGLTRLPADNLSQIDHVSEQPLRVASRRRELLLLAARQVALTNL